jgi:hypothetical protein
LANGEIRRRKENKEDCKDYLLPFLKISTTITRIATMNTSIPAISPVRTPEVLGSICFGGVVVGAAVGAEEGFCAGFEADAVVVGATGGVSVSVVVGACEGVWVAFAVGTGVGAGVGVGVGTGVC